MFKKKSTQVIAGVVLLLVIVLGGYYVVAGSKAKPVEDQTTDTSIQTLSPQEIGLSLQPSPDKKRIKFKIAKATDISTIEYELIYEADSTKQEISDGGEERVQRGITGQANIDGKSSYESDFLVLGSESANTVRYDTGVKSVKITLKISKKDGKVYQVEDKLDL